ncbi:MAG: hypothetical protein IPP59_05630 [Betaproteobacteria bacterium]|nr:hypothetical protein [Candidatus Dechloromonas phosphorivorans]
MVCFDTAFHRAQPAVAQAFAPPAEITERGVRRFGFHGLPTSTLPQFCWSRMPVPLRARCRTAPGMALSMCAMQVARAWLARWASPRS